MPYIENRIVHDADAHTMELPNWYDEFGSKKVQDSMGKMTHLLDENISGSDLVKIYNAQKSEERKFFKLIKISIFVFYIISIIPK